MTLSIFHGIGILLLGIALTGTVDSWIGRIVGVLLVIAGAYTSWVYRRQFGDGRPEK